MKAKYSSSRLCFSPRKPARATTPSTLPQPGAPQHREENPLADRPSAQEKVEPQGLQLKTRQPQGWPMKEVRAERKRAPQAWLQASAEPAASVPRVVPPAWVV